MHNNKIIYQFIVKLLKNLILVNNNYEIIKIIVTYNILKCKDIVFDTYNTKQIIEEQINSILRSIYNKNYYSTQQEIKNHKPTTIKDTVFIEQVKQNQYILPKKIKNISWKKEIEKHFKIKISSNNNFIGRIAHRHLGDNSDKLPSDMLDRIVQKAYEGYKSYYKLYDKGLKPSMPKYLPKNSSYVLPFSIRSFIIENNENIRLTVGQYVGQYVSNNYDNITKNTELVCLNKTENTDKKKYIKKCQMKKGNRGKCNNYNIDDKHIDKKNKNIINAYYINLYLPPKLKNAKINNIEVVPLYENHSYKFCIRYVKQITTTVYHDISQINPDDSISIDFGMGNLMAIYDPTGRQNIISGKYLLWLNKRFNNKIDKLKSLCKKVNNKDTSIQIRNLLIRQSNLIKEYFNDLANLLLKMYKHKSLVIFGYNINWKNRVNMGRKLNRQFYSIPYSKLLDILTTKFRENGVACIINEESYTSKCDSLSLENVCKHDTYMGKRIKRGLFSSKTNKLINADLNGAINIMRKCYLRFGLNLNEIKGHRLYNPIIIKCIP